MNAKNTAETPPAAVPINGNIPVAFAILKPVISHYG
jgi:hypothetical protein